MSKPSRNNFRGIAINAEGVPFGAIYAESGAFVVYSWAQGGGFSGEKSAPLTADKFTFARRFDNGFRIEKHYEVAA